MLWIGVSEALSIAVIGGLVGACIMGCANKLTLRFVLNRIEELWSEDIYVLKNAVTSSHCKISALEAKLSTKSVANAVSNARNESQNNGNKHQRHFNQRG